jgi:hypothetical protein
VSRVVCVIPQEMNDLKRKISLIDLTTGDNKCISETRKMRRKTVKFNKTDVRYWESRVAFHMPASRSYSLQIQHGGERRWLGLGTANKKDAAALALKLYLDVRANGWEVVMSRRRGDPAVKKINVTVGEYIETVAARSLFSPKTLQSYEQALRKITGDIVGETKREKRDAIKLRTLTPEKIEAWRIEFIRKKATDPLKEKSARISAGSFLLRARALFSAETVARVRDLVELTEPMPFSGIKAEIHARYGLLAASEQLRHGGIGVTARHYVENRQPSVLGLGHLLKGERTIVPMQETAPAS